MFLLFLLQDVCISGVWTYFGETCRCSTEPGLLQMLPYSSSHIWMDYQNLKKYRIYNYVHGVYIPGIIQNIWTVQLLIVGIWMDWTHYLGIIIHHGHFQITHADFKNVFSNGQYNHVSSFFVHMYLWQVCTCISFAEIKERKMVHKSFG